MQSYQMQLLYDAITSVTALEGTLLIVKPEDYSPSKWVTYKGKTAEIQKMRRELEQLYNSLATL